MVRGGRGTVVGMVTGGRRRRQGRLGAALLAVGVLALLLAACGSSGTGAPVDAQDPSAAAQPAEPEQPRSPQTVFVYPPPVEEPEEPERPATPEPERTPTVSDEDDATPADEPEPEPQPTSRTPLAGFRIAIDPGHNGGNFDVPQVINELVDAGGFTKPCNTTGAVAADGYRESTFNIELALILRARLLQLGAEVEMTRVDDLGVGPCIDVRGRFGGEVDADLLLSLHADGAPASASGFHVIRPASARAVEPAIVEPSRELAEAVRDAMIEFDFTPADYVGDEGLVVRDDLGTLNLSTVPAVLLEAGNLGNPDEAAELRDPMVQRVMAEALATAVARHLGVI